MPEVHERMSEGHLLLVLHCHLPYVRHPEYDDFLEEDWLFEAVAETYVPILYALERLAADEVPAKMTLSFSPTLCEMLANPLLQERCVRYLERHVELARKEVDRTAGSPVADAARMYRDHYEAVHRTYVERLEGDLLQPFADLARRGRLELLGSAGTHALLPLTATPEARRAQVAVGLRNFEKHFGDRPTGFWLPECAFTPGLDKLLGEFGYRYFFVDTMGVLLADPKPVHGVFAPLETDAGVFAFGRDVESSAQVWSVDEGYPGDGVYREFYRDLGFDAPMDYIAPYLHADGVRRYLGLKYHRITDDVPLDEKEPYDPAAAARKATEHAAHFIAQREDQVERVRSAAGIAPVIVAPYDAELFGHWWWEGPQFLEQVLRTAAQSDRVACVTPSECLQSRRQAPGELQRGAPAMSSWGDGGYFEVWVNGTNDWVYPPLHRAESAMVAAAGEHLSADGLTRRALDQCARQLMLAQCSDWPFLMYSGTAKTYATGRVTDLLSRFDRLMTQVRTGSVDPELLTEYERLDDAFPEMDYRAFAGAARLSGPSGIGGAAHAPD